MARTILGWSRGTPVLDGTVFRVVVFTRFPLTELELESLRQKPESMVLNLCR